MAVRVPTDEEYAAYDGEDCRRLWESVGPNWRCPSCNRTLREIMRWTKKGPRPFKGIHEPFWGWRAGLHEHHDHRQGEHVDLGRGRFPATIICDQCNSCEGNAKWRLKLPKEFSFSPQEIAQFVTATPHGKTKIDLGKAREIYERSHRGRPWSA